MPDLTKAEWHKLSSNQIWALETIYEISKVELEATAPLSARIAFHDLWRFGFAKRSFNPLSYSITELGRKCLAELAAEAFSFSHNG